jgi:hypothetical protein
MLIDLPLGPLYMFIPPGPPMLICLPLRPLDMLMPPGPPMDIVLVAGDAREEFGVLMPVLDGVWGVHGATAWDGAVGGAGIDGAGAG